MNLFIASHRPSFTAVLIAADHADHALAIAKASPAFEGADSIGVRPLDLPSAGGVVLHLGD
jgi:hypothetical protein